MKYFLPMAFLLLLLGYATGNLAGHNYMTWLSANGKTIDSLSLADTNRTPWLRYPGPWPATSMYIRVKSTAADTVHVEMLGFTGRDVTLDSARSPLRIYQPARSATDDSIAVCRLIPGTTTYEAVFRVYEMIIDRPIALTRGFPYDYKPARTLRYEILAYDEGAK